MQSYNTGPFIDTRPTCVDCDAPLPPGNRWRCSECVAAAYRAVAEAGGRIVRPSDIARTAGSADRGATT